jgi:hypothetical protein
MNVAPVLVREVHELSRETNCFLQVTLLRIWLPFNVKNKAQVDWSITSSIVYSAEYNGISGSFVVDVAPPRNLI